MTGRRPSTLGRRLRSLYVWHRWLGVVAVLFMLLFAATGLTLNHTEQLKLDSRHLQHEFWLGLYGLDTDVEVRGFEQRGHWFSQARGRLYFDAQFIAEGPAPLAAVALDAFWVLASSSQLILLDTNGYLLETVSADRLPGRITAIGQLDDQLILHSPYASFTGNIDDLQWQPVSATTPSAAPQPGPIPEVVALAIREDARAHALNWERVLLDLHSGRLFGLLGVYVMDGAAITLIILSLSGLLLWLRYQRGQWRIRKRRQAKAQ